jgi:hypothetical protein
MQAVVTDFCAFLVLHFSLQKKMKKRGKKRK